MNRDRRLQLYQRANRPNAFREARLIAVAGKRHQKYTNGLLFLLSSHHPFTAVARLDRVKNVYEYPRCRSVNGRFHLKSRSLGAGQRDHYPGSRGKRKRASTPRRTLKYAEFTPRSREYGSASLTKRTPRLPHPQKFFPIKVAQFRNTSTRSAVSPFLTFSLSLSLFLCFSLCLSICLSTRFFPHVHVHSDSRGRGGGEGSTPLCHCAALIKTRALPASYHRFRFLAASIPDETLERR